MATERRSAIKSIRKFCVDVCCAGDAEYVRECPGFKNIPSVQCVLYPYRMGKNPNISEATRIKRQESAKSRNFGAKHNTGVILEA